LARGEGQQLLNPLAQAEMKARAWEYAQRDIFMGDNAFTKWFNDGLRVGPKDSNITRAVKSGARVAFPIVKVPTNYALEVSDYALGLPKAAARIGGVLKAGSKAAVAARDLGSIVRAGLEKVGPQQAEQIMRQLKKGSLGAALIALGATGAFESGGFYEPRKRRREGELQPGEVRIAGLAIPHMILHHPAIEALQIGAELHRQRTLAEGLKNAALGVGESVPFFEEPIRAARSIRDNPAQLVGEQVRGLTIPPDVQRLARVLDQRGEHTAAEQLLQGLGWQHIDANRRKVRGSLPQRLLKEEELGIPGLRPLASAQHAPWISEDTYDGSGDSYPTIISDLQATGWNPRSLLKGLPADYQNPDVTFVGHSEAPYGSGPDDWKPGPGIVDVRETDAGREYRPKHDIGAGGLPWVDSAGVQHRTPLRGPLPPLFDHYLLREIEARKRKV
jgi:hypothetical protein